MVTKAQIKKIHILKKVLGLDEDLYREMLLMFNVQSSKDLLTRDACKLIDILEVRAIGIYRRHNPKQKFDELSNRADMATPAQLRKIEAMWVSFLKMSLKKEVIKGSIARKSLRKLLKRLYHISDLRFLERDKVSKVLKTIQSMINRQLTAN